MSIIKQETADLQVLYYLRDYCQKLVERYQNLDTEKLARELVVPPTDAREIASMIAKAAVKKRDFFSDQITFAQNGKR